MRDDDRDFAEFFEARSGRLHRVAYALCGDWPRAEELTQATFERLYRHWGKVRRGHPDAYARRTLTNLYLDGVRRSREVLVEAAPERPGVRALDDDVVTRVDLRRGLAALAPQQRAVVVLRFLEDLSVREVALCLGIAEGTVKSHTSKALTALGAGAPADHDHHEVHP